MWKFKIEVNMLKLVFLRKLIGENKERLLRITWRLQESLFGSNVVIPISFNTPIIGSIAKMRKMAPAKDQTMLIKEIRNI